MWFAGMMSVQFSVADIGYMRQALFLAGQQSGKTGSNPSVGCVIVLGDVVIGAGATGDGGRPHGEAMALSTVVGSPQGATAYVTLEPCAHESERGGSCTDALIVAGVERLVCCLQDPDPRTSGRGFERMVQAGIVVDVGLLHEEGRDQIAEFTARFG
jgi:diaminohydroxyphosphoribosylaminopyrimidine deaminase / 5-amino-6-(5-phosphoribosylamino)uracil reductase